MKNTVMSFVLLFALSPSLPIFSSPEKSVWVEQHDSIGFYLNRINAASSGWRNPEKTKTIYESRDGIKAALQKTIDLINEGEVETDPQTLLKIVKLVAESKDEDLNLQNAELFGLSLSEARPLLEDREFANLCVKIFFSFMAYDRSHGTMNKIIYSSDVRSAAVEVFENIIEDLPAGSLAFLLNEIDPESHSKAFLFSSSATYDIQPRWSEFFSYAKTVYLQKTCPRR